MPSTQSRESPEVCETLHRRNVARNAHMIRRYEQRTKAGSYMEAIAKQAMSRRISNIETATYEVGESGRRGEAAFRFLDLSGQHLGVRIEEIPAGGTTSHHHYHTAEEEHVVLLSGTATLHLGQDRVELSSGDHTWFPAGEEVPHHIENTSDVPIRLLVFGERKKDDVVFYPKRSVVLVKSSAGLRPYAYEERDGGGDENS